MQKLGRLATIVIAICIAAFSPSSSIIADPMSEKKIGILLSLTGDFAIFGQEAKRGALVALDEIKAAGHSAPELIFEDDKCLPADAVRGFNKLIKVDRVPIVVGPGCTGGIMSVGPLAQAARVTHLALFDTNDEVKRAGSYTFGLGFASERGAHLAAQEMRRRGYRNAAVLYETDAWATVMRDAFVKKFKEIGGTIVSDETQSPADKDWRPNLTKLRSRNPDSLYLIPAYNGGLPLKQIALFGLKLPIFGPDTFGTPDVVAIAGEAAEGVIFTNVALDEQNKDAQNFIARFNERFGEPPSIYFYAGLAYDGVHFAWQALQHPAGPSEGLKTLRPSRSALGVTGFDATRMSDIPLKLWTIRNGKLMLLDNS